MPGNTRSQNFVLKTGVAKERTGNYTKINTQASTENEIRQTHKMNLQLFAEIEDCQCMDEESVEVVE